MRFFAQETTLDVTYDTPYLETHAILITSYEPARYHELAAWIVYVARKVLQSR